MTEQHTWFDVLEVEPGIHVIDEPHHVEQVKSHLIVGEDRAILIDTGMGIANIRDVVESLTDKPITVINSHAHWDHVGGNHLFEDIRIHPAEADDLTRGFPNERMKRWFQPESLTGPLPDEIDLDILAIPASRPTGMLSEGQQFDIGGRTVEILHCPGHSPGGVALLDRANGILFSTDLAYKGYLYAYRGPWLETYRRSLERLAALAPALRVLYPSHHDAVVSPGILGQAAHALQRVVNGEPPSRTEGEMAEYSFGDVGVYLFPER